MSASRPSAAGVAPAIEEETGRQTRQERQAQPETGVPGVVEQHRGDDEDGPAQHAIEHDRGPARRREAAAPVPEADEEDEATEHECQRHLPGIQPAHEGLIGDAGIRGPDELEEGLGGVQAEGRVECDPRRRQQPDVRPSKDAAVVRPAEGAPLEGHRCPVPRDRVAVEREGGEVDERVGKEAGRPQHCPDGAGGREAARQARDGGRLEAR